MTREQVDALRFGVYKKKYYVGREVDAAMESIAAALDDMNAQITNYQTALEAMQQKYEAACAELERYREDELLIARTLIAARKVAELQSARAAALPATEAAPALNEPAPAAPQAAEEAASAQPAAEPAPAAAESVPGPTVQHSAGEAEGANARGETPQLPRRSKEEILELLQQILQ